MAFAHTLCHWTSERGWRPGANPTWQHSKPFAPSTESQCILCLNKWHDQYEKKHDMKPGDIISKLKHPARPRQNWDVPRSQSKGRKLMYPSDLMLILWVQKCWNGSRQLRMGLHHPENVSGVKNAISVSWIVRHHRLFHTWFSPSIKNYCANTGAKQNAPYPRPGPFHTSDTGQRRR